MEDRELVRKLLEKDEAAFRYFYETYREKLYKSCVYQLGYQDSDAEDVTQEVFLAAFRQLPQFEFRSSLKNWLLRIGMYLCYQKIRQRKRLVVSETEALEMKAQPLAVARQNKEEEDKEKQQMMELLKTQKQLLGDPCRELLELRDEREQSYAQMADSLKVPIGTVMSRLARCKQTLKELFLRAWKEGSHG